MAIKVPISGETLLDAKHLEMHQIIAIDPDAPHETLTVDKSAKTKAANDLEVTNNVYARDAAGLACDFDVPNQFVYPYGQIAEPLQYITEHSGGNIGFSQTSFGTNAAKVLGMGSGTAPTSSVVDMAQMWVADRGGTAGEASFHMRNETGNEFVFGKYVGLHTKAPGAHALEIQGSTGAATSVNIQTSAGNYSLLQFTRPNYGVVQIGGEYGKKEFHVYMQTTGYVFLIDQTGYLSLGAESTPDQLVEINQVETITSATADGYAAALRLDPGYTAATAQTVTRHNYIEFQDVSVAGTGPAAVTDACALRFDAALGTHKATTNVDKSGNSADGTIKVNVNGTIHHIQLYAD